MVQLRGRTARGVINSDAACCRRPTEAVSPITCSNSTPRARCSSRSAVLPSSAWCPSPATANAPPAGSAPSASTRSASCVAGADEEAAPRWSMERCEKR